MIDSINQQAIRIDQWLWAARFYKTRKLAVRAIRNGKVEVNNNRVKPAKMLHMGDQLKISKNNFLYEITVLGITTKRVSAKIAVTLYQESQQSIDKRKEQLKKLKLERMFRVNEPTVKPDKHARRALNRLKRKSGDDFK